MRRSALVFVATLVLAACSLGPREEWAEAMRGAADAADVGTASVKQTVTVKAIETNIRQQPQPLIARSSGIADFSRVRAALDGTTPRKTRVVYADLVVYATRSKASIGPDRRRWARFDFEREPEIDIDDNDRRMAVGAGLISPVLAVELLDGVLTGSVRRVGTGTKAGVPTTRYSARLAPDAAINEIDDEDRRQGILRMFATLGVQQDDFPVDVWMDADNRVRGLRFVMRQQKDRVNAFTLTSSWEFTGYGTADEVGGVPSRRDAVASGRFRDFVTELIREAV